MQNQVVVTGIGAVTPIGTRKEEFWENLKKGKSGVIVIDHFREYPTYIAAIVQDFEPQLYMEKRDIKKRTALPNLPWRQPDGPGRCGA